MKYLLQKKELVLLLLLIGIFIAIRSIHFTSYLNFSTDQGLFSLEALKIYNEKSLTLIGPPMSYSFQGRELFQGGIIYYGFLFFLLLGNFDPVTASYFFMLFAGVMLIPLFYGTKHLLSVHAAWVVALCYALLPIYIDYTRFLWNPNFQLVLLPVLLFFMGLFAKTEKHRYLFLVALTSGILLQ